MSAILFLTCVSFPNKIRAEAVQKRSATSENLQLVAFHGLEDSAAWNLADISSGNKPHPQRQKSPHLHNQRSWFLSHNSGLFSPIDFKFEMWRFLAKGYK